MLNKSPNTGFINMPINNSDKHLKNLIELLPWQSSFGQRKVCSIGVDYKYSGQTVKGHPFSIYKPLQGLIDKVNKQLGTNYNSILVNWYPRGTNVGINAHSDNEPELVSGSSVLSISLGETVNFVLRATSGNESITVPLSNGDVFLMGNNCQRFYKHSIPRQRMSGDRISLTFREFI